MLSHHTKEPRTFRELHNYILNFGVLTKPKIEKAVLYLCIINPMLSSLRGTIDAIADDDTDALIKFYWELISIVNNQLQQK